VGGGAVSVGGNGADYGVGIAVDANDEAWVVGISNSNNFPVTADAYEVYCSPVAASFNFNTGQYSGEFSSCANNNSGGEYIYGAESAFIVKLDPTGTQILYGTFLGGSDTNLPQQIAIDSGGNVYVAGETSSAVNTWIRRENALSWLKRFQHGGPGEYRFREVFCYR
jgi:hypothetical protein